MERGHTAHLIRTQAQHIAAEEIRKEIQEIIRSRYTWKRRSDFVEVISKLLTSISSVLAFASSAIRDPKIADILAFTSGTVGTTGLVLNALSTYAGKESQERTNEVNNLLHSIGVTPIPQISDAPGSSRRS